MNLANPTALLWGMLAIPIVIFYILKLRLRRVPVSTVIFWRQIFEEKKPRSIWQRLRHHRYEPHVIQVHDQREADPRDMLGDLELFDIETESARRVTVTERNLRQYRRLFGEFQEAVKGYCRKYGLGCTRTTTDIPFDELILKMMRVAGAVR